MRKRKNAASTKPFTWALLTKHFRGFEISELITSSRIFPITARVDLQKALEQFVTESSENKLIGLHQDWSRHEGTHETISAMHAPVTEVAT